MFYCDPCRVEKSWPSNVMGALSNGRCQVCGKPALCHDVPPSALPALERAPIGNDSPERRHAVAEIPAEGAYDKRDRGKMIQPEPGAPAGGYSGSLEQMGYPSPPLVEAERIVAAAVQIEGVTISLPQPARHGTILACTSYSLNMESGRELQGFLTSTGRFVNRIQARHIANIAGQKPGRSGGRDNPELYSEDLW